MNVRETALELLMLYENGGKYSNLLLSSHITNGLDRSDMNFLTSLVYNVVEHKITYDYYISSYAKRGTGEIDQRVLNILRLGACQIIDFDSIPDFAAVNETVSLAKNKGERAFCNSVMRRICENKNALPMPPREKNEARYLSVKYSFPQSTVKFFIGLFGAEETEKLFSSYNKIPPTDITVNTTKISKEEYLKKLTELGFDAKISPIAKNSIRISKSVPPRALYGFDEGLFFVQDSSCLAAIEALDVFGGAKIIDVCAAPGGKSFAAQILASNTALIDSFDVHESKLSLITGGKERLGLDNIRVGVRDASQCHSESVGRYDRLICDVPCSGLGVIAKKADMRYKDIGAVSELPPLQFKILSASAQYLKVGGVGIYSTCTVNPAENIQVFSEFLKTHPCYESVDFSVGDLKSSDGQITLYPHIHGTDGFFIAKFRRKSGEPCQNK